MKLPRRSIDEFCAAGRSSHEERGLKSIVEADRLPFRARRSSHEERGLKYILDIQDIVNLIVAPRMRSVD